MSKSDEVKPPEDELSPFPWYRTHYTGHASHYHEDDSMPSYVGAIYDANDKLVYAGPFAFHSLKGEANARAMTAAPELLQACKAVVQHAYSPKPTKGWTLAMEAALQLAREAIAKAEGLSLPDPTVEDEE